MILHKMKYLHVIAMMLQQKLQVHMHHLTTHSTLTSQIIAPSGINQFIQVQRPIFSLQCSTVYHLHQQVTSCCDSQVPWPFLEEWVRQEAVIEHFVVNYSKIIPTPRLCVDYDKVWRLWVKIQVDHKATTKNMAPYWSHGAINYHHYFKGLSQCSSTQLQNAV